MFTGIVEEIGHVRTLEHHSAGATVIIACTGVLEGTAIGASISVNGACLTATALGTDFFVADLAPETLLRTNLVRMLPGSPVNLERPMRANGRLDGHFVLGHVDGTAEIAAIDEVGDGNWWLKIEMPPGLSRYVVEKGSVALDGISLTVAAISGEHAAFTVIPHTWRNTALHARKPGDAVNVEVDILAKHLEKLVASSSSRP